jgi:hypothetical protein
MSGLAAPKSSFQLVAAIALVMGAGISMMPKVLGDPDTYWHLAAGEWILRHAAVPQTDPFSYTFAGKPWTAHEWLAEVVLALAHRLAGWSGVLLLAGAAFAGVIAITGAYLRKWLGPLTLLVMLVFVGSGIAPSLLARPHLLALPLLAAWLVGLLSARDAGRAPSPWLLPVMLVWANLHGSFVLGLGFLGVFALEAVIADPPKIWSTVRKWAPFGLAALAMTLITPHGVEGLLFPFQVADMSSLAIIGEWRSADFSKLQAFEIVLLEGLFFILWLGVRVPPLRILILLGFLHLALRHERHQMVFVTVAALLLAEPLALAFRQRGMVKADAPVPSRAPGWWGAALAAILVLAAAVRLSWPVERRDSATPAAALKAVPPSLRSTPVFNAYDFGGYLIFAGVRPYIDGRADLYGDKFVIEHNALLQAPKDEVQRHLDKYAVQWTLLQPEVPMVAVLDGLPGWRRLWADKTAVVHVRRDLGPEPPQ